jgi:hypothetical protein
VQVGRMEYGSGYGSHRHLTAVTEA